MLNKIIEKAKYDTLILENDLNHVKQLESAASKQVRFNIIYTTSKASEAWQIIVEKQPDLVIMDLHLDEGDGFELVLKIRQTFDDTNYYPFIAIVSLQLGGLMTRSLLLPYADDLWTKNAYYNPEYVFSNFLLKRKAALLLHYHFPDVLNKSPIKALVISQLDAYTITKSNRRRIPIIVEVLACAIEQPIGITSFENATRYTAETHAVPKSAVKNSFLDFIADVFKDTDDEVLKEVYPDYRSSPPTASEFFFEILDLVREKLKMQF